MEIKEIKVTCRKCKTKVIMPIGRSVRSCPACCESFDIDPMDDLFVQIKNTLDRMDKAPMDIEFVCEDNNG